MSWLTDMFSGSFLGVAKKTAGPELDKNIARKDPRWKFQGAGLNADLLDEYAKRTGVSQDTVAKLRRAGSGPLLDAGMFYDPDTASDITADVRAFREFEATKGKEASEYAEYLKLMASRPGRRATILTDTSSNTVLGNGVMGKTVLGGI